MIDWDPAGVSINPERAQESNRMQTDVHLTQTLTTSLLAKHWNRCVVRSEGVCAFVLQYEGRSDGKRRDAGRRVCESESPSPYLPPTLAIFTVYLTASSTTAWTHTHTHTHTYIFGSGIGYFDLNLHTDICNWPESLWGHWAAPSDCLSLLRSQWIIFAPYN